jgi:putative membrane protein
LSVEVDKMTTLQRFRPAIWMVAVASSLALSACDRNTAPPQQPKTHVIELTRGDDSPSVQARTDGATAPAAPLPYGAAAPMAPGTDGVHSPGTEVSRTAALPTGLDQAPPDALMANAPTGAGTPAAAPSVALSATEMAFITQATEAGLFNLRIGQLGVERATNSAVKSYAALLVADQATLNNGLQQLGRRLGVPLPSSLSEPKQQVVDSLARTGTIDFDQQFINAVGVRDHAATIELFERTGRETRHPLVRSFVLSTLPALRAHIGAAEKLPVKG